MVTMIIIGLISFFGILINLIPVSIPPISSDFSSAGSFIINNVTQVFNFLAYIIGSNFLIVLLIMFSVYLGFDLIYNIIFFILRKIPFLDIRQ